MAKQHVRKRSCPFCGWHCTDMQSFPDLRRGRRGATLYVVQCCSAGCGALGPTRETAREAAAAWDRRAASADRLAQVVTLRVVK